MIIKELGGTPESMKDDFRALNDLFKIGFNSENLDGSVIRDVQLKANEWVQVSHGLNQKPDFMLKLSQAGLGSFENQFTDNTVRLRSDSNITISFVVLSG